MLPSQLITIYNTPRDRLIDVALKLAAMDPDKFIELLKDIYEGVVFGFNGTEYEIPAKTCLAIQHMSENQKITAIKAIRESTGMALLEAKCFVEIFAASGYMEYNNRSAVSVDPRCTLVHVHSNIKMVR